MLALLDKIPIWKQLKELPQRVESLEKRIAELENKPISTGDVCPKCKNKTFELISTRKCCGPCMMNIPVPIGRC
jgi:hypothetical protein